MESLNLRTVQPQVKCWNLGISERAESSNLSTLSEISKSWRNFSESRRNFRIFEQAKLQILRRRKNSESCKKILEGEKSRNLRRRKISESQKKNLEISKEEKSRNPGRREISESQKEKILGLKKRFSKSQKKKILESLNERNFEILEEEKYIGISKRAKFWKL
jgi:hypothetical protein